MLFKKSFGLLSSLFVASVLFSLPTSASATGVTLEQFATDRFPHRLFGENTYYFDYSETGSSLTLELNEENGTAVLWGTNQAIVKDAAGGNTIGTATSTIELAFSGLSYDTAFEGRDVVAVGLAGEASSKGTLSFDIALDGEEASSGSLNIASGFFDPFRNETNERIWGFVGTSFNFLLSQNGGSYIFDSWVNSSGGSKIALGEELLRFQGDIHLRGEPLTGTAEVPEPSTVLLLGLGALGLAIRQRNQAA